MPKDNSEDPSALIAGLDEVGRGSWAGPLLVVVAGFPRTASKVKGVKDSKKLTKLKRQEVLPQLLESVAFLGFGWASALEIDDLGISTAWQRACTIALRGIPSNTILYVDGDTRVENYHGTQNVVVRADATIWQVSAASVIAKEARDLVMADDSRAFPYYAWEKNAGYGTHQHQLAILAHGITPHHRLTFLKKMNARLSAKLHTSITA